MTCHVEDHVHPIKVEKCPDGMSDVDAVVSWTVLNDRSVSNGQRDGERESASTWRAPCALCRCFSTPTRM